MLDETAFNEAWLRRFRPAKNASARLVCLPHAGGATSAFFPLFQAFDSDIDLVAVQYPGRQERRRQAPLQDVHRLADEVAAALAPLTDLPLVLFGHSLGALIGLETAARLESAGDHPLIGLIASGRHSPTAPRHETVHLRDDDGLIEEVASLSGTSPLVLADPDMRAMVLPALRADYTAAETYRYASDFRLECPLSVFTGTEDPHVTEAEALAWEQLTTGAFRVRRFGGGHFYLNGSEQEIAAAVLKDIHLFSGGTVGATN